MELVDRIVVVTGGASGIGASLSRRFLDEGARAVVIADREGDAAMAVANRLGDRARAISADVGVEADVEALVERTEDDVGPIDLFFSNAGQLGDDGGIDAPDEVWADLWQVNVLGHLYSARAVIPRMLERGEGYFLTNASAAGLLSLPGNAPYSVTKHATVALSEWIAFTYGAAGIRTSCICSLTVDAAPDDSSSGPPSKTPVSYNPTGTGEVADAVIEGLRDERFLILPQPEVAKLEQVRADDREGYLAGMGRLHSMLESGAVSGPIIDFGAI